GFGDDGESGVMDERVAGGVEAEFFGVQIEPSGGEGEGFLLLLLVAKFQHPPTKSAELLRADARRVREFKGDLPKCDPGGLVEAVRIGFGGEHLGGELGSISDAG